MNQNMFRTKSRLLTQKTSHTKNCTQGFIVSIFLLVQTAVKLRNLRIHENYQL